MKIYEIDELANLVPMAGEKEQEALTYDIAKNGQNDPAVLWRDRIVDGRCRQLACIALGVELKVRKVDSELSREQVGVIVKSLNVRRNLTMTQKIMSAIKEQESTKVTNDEAARTWGISIGTLKSAKYINMYRPDLVEDLFNGKAVELEDPDRGYNVTTNKVNTIARIIKKQREVGKVVVDDSEEIEFSVDGVLKTEAAKDWYYRIVNTIGITDPAIKILMVELANLKFKKREDDDVLCV